MHANTWANIGNLLDNNARPLFPTDNLASFNALGANKNRESRGLVGMWGQIPVYVDMTIPLITSGANSWYPIIVGNFSQNYLYATPPMIKFLDQAFIATNNSYALSLDGWGAFGIRFGGATCVITGVGLTKPSVV